MAANIKNIVSFIFVYAAVAAAVYSTCILLPSALFGIKFGLPAMVYIIQSASAVILATWGDRVGAFLNSLLFRGSKRSINRVDRKRIRFALIFVYFAAIVIFTLAALMSVPLFHTEQLDYSIIQSFATYIAYDRLVRNYPTIARG